MPLSEEQYLELNSQIQEKRNLANFAAKNDALGSVTATNAEQAALKKASAIAYVRDERLFDEILQLLHEARAGYLKVREENLRESKPTEQKK